jgi:hypothetical protein
MHDSRANEALSASFRQARLFNYRFQRMALPAAAEPEGKTVEVMGATMRGVNDRQPHRAPSPGRRDPLAGFFGPVLGPFIGFVWELRLGTPGWFMVGFAVFLGRSPTDSESASIAGSGHTSLMALLTLPSNPALQRTRFARLARR